MLDASQLLIPALPLGAWIIVRGARRRAGVGTVVLQLVVLVHLTAVVAVAFFPFPVQAELIHRNRELQLAHNNLIPLSSLIHAIATGTTPSVVAQSVGNLVMLAPLGMYLPALVRRARRVTTVVLVGLALSLAIELGQLLISTLLGYAYKIADVDDVILNTAGVAIGFAGFWLIGPWRPHVAVRRFSVRDSK